MKAAILNIGNELLQGFTVNTNASWLARELTDHSIEVRKILVVEDSKDSIARSLESMLNDSYDYIFVTGGLGPTHDDVTHDAISFIFGSKKAISKIPNKHGTAKGVYVNSEKSKVFFLPGVPREFRQMVVDEIVAKHFKKNKTPGNILTFNTCGIFESKLADLLNPILNSYLGCYDFSFLPDYTGVKLRAKRKLDSIHDEEKEKRLIMEIKNQVGSYIYSLNDVTLEQAVAKILIDEKMTIAVAESCTGGSISKRLTDVSGSSKYFLGSIIAYSNDVKTREIGVHSNIIDQFGAVSKEVCSMMAESIRRKFNAEIGVSCTGISGPSGGTRLKPVGLVYIGVALRGHTEVEKYVLVDDRRIHRRMTSQLALNIVRLALSK